MKHTKTWDCWMRGAGLYARPTGKLKTYTEKKQTLNKWGKPVGEQIDHSVQYCEDDGITIMQADRTVANYDEFSLLVGEQYEYHYELHDDGKMTQEDDAKMTQETKKSTYDTNHNRIVYDYEYIVKNLKVLREIEAVSYHETDPKFGPKIKLKHTQRWEYWGWDDGQYTGLAQKFTEKEESLDIYGEKEGEQIDAFTEYWEDGKKKKEYYLKEQYDTDNYLTKRRETLRTFDTNEKPTDHWFDYDTSYIAVSEKVKVSDEVKYDWWWYDSGNIMEASRSETSYFKDTAQAQSRIQEHNYYYDNAEEVQKKQYYEEWENYESGNTKQVRNEYRGFFENNQPEWEQIELVKFYDVPGYYEHWYYHYTAWDASGNIIIDYGWDEWYDPPEGIGESNVLLSDERPDADVNNRADSEQAEGSGVVTNEFEQQFAVQAEVEKQFNDPLFSSQMADGAGGNLQAQNQQQN